MKYQGSEKETKNTRTLSGCFCFFSFGFRPRAAAVYQCTEPILTHLWIFITPQRLGGMDSSSPRGCTDMSGVDLRDSVVRPLRSRTQKEQRVLSQCDSLMPPPPAPSSCLNTRARIAHTHHSAGARCRWRARCHGDGRTTARHLANKEGSRNVASRGQN